jgi:hypothetical protein
MGWVKHVACMEKKGNTYRNWWGKVKERDGLEDLVLDGRVVLK